jgi:mannose-6-phosphate isomerase-like protein (cupin superfamily)
VINLSPKSKISLQRHKHRTEHWVVVAGTAIVTRGDEVVKLKQNESTYIPRGMVHRLENKTDETLEVIEVQSGDYLGEDDIERFDDDYGRHK